MVMALVGSSVALATPSGAVTHPESGGLFASVDHISGTAAATSGYALTSVYVALGRVDPATYLWEYWNWSTQSWGDWDWTQSRKLATGTADWEITSGLPGVWDKPWQHNIWVYVYDDLPSYGVVNSGFYIGLTRPSCSITSPTNGGVYEYLEEFTGTASGEGGELDYVGVVLQFNYSGTWYWWDWAAQLWRNYNTTPFDAARGYTTAEGTESWSVSEGVPWRWYKDQSYRVLARAFNSDGAFSLQLALANFTIQSADAAWPIILIDPPAPWPDHFTGTVTDEGTGVAWMHCYLGSYDSATGSYNRWWNWGTQSWQTSQYSPTGCARALPTDSEEWEISSGLPEWEQSGLYRLDVMAWDHVGNYGRRIRDFYTWDSTWPTVTITHPSSWPDCLSGTAADADSGVAAVKCYLRFYDTSCSCYKWWNWETQSWQDSYSTPGGCFGTATGTEEWQISTGLPAWKQWGHYRLYAFAYDEVGNYRSAYRDFVVHDDYRPTGTITYPVADEWYYPGITRIAGTAADEGGSGIEKVMCYLGWWDTEAAVMKWWNWVTQTWDLAQEAPYPEEWLALATGTEEWEVTSGFPSEWPMCEPYVAIAIVYDGAGNQSFPWLRNEFWVGDNIAPVIHGVTASPDTLWPPNHKMVDVTVFVDATDNIDPNPVSRITGVTCSEPMDGPGDGSTKPDWEITGDLTVRLRAERAGCSTGRVYTIAVECTDFCGNSSTSSVDVTVPHDQGN